MIDCSPSLAFLDPRSTRVRPLGQRLRRVTIEPGPVTGLIAAASLSARSGSSGEVARASQPCPGRASKPDLQAVTAVPDEKKGERLIVLHTKLTKGIDELRRALSSAGLPNLFIPSTDSFIEVESIPILGTGKLDLRALKKLAQEKVAEEKVEA